jgi:putative hemolysin
MGEGTGLDLAGLGLETLIVLILIGLNGLFAMAEIAVVSSRKIRLQQNAESGQPGAAAALRLAQEPTRFLSTVQIGISLIGVVAGYFGGARLAARISDMLIDAGVSEGISEALSVAGVLLAITYLSLVFGEIVPKRVGLHNPERIASRIAFPMLWVSRAAAPFVAVLTASANSVLRILNLKGEEEAALSEEEIRLMIGMSAESGRVAEEEAELLDRVFHFGDRQVHEVMTPRTETVWLEAGMTIGGFYEVYGETPHSRFPVFDGSPDTVVGILGIKDVLAALSRERIGRDSPIQPLLRPAFFVPETKAVGELFREMQAKGVQMAVAVDEFGGTAGIVTLEQLLEEMVGPMHDEVRPAESEIQAIDDRTLRLDGGLSIDEARNELEIDIPDGPYDTIAGFVLSQLGHIPVTGEQVAFDGYRLTVEAMRGPKIELLRLTRGA